MNSPAVETLIQFIRDMPVIGEGLIRCSIGPNPYPFSLESKAHEIFEEDRNWNVLGMVRIEEALELKRWKKTEAVLWSVGLSLPCGSRHAPELGSFSFDEGGKRLFGNWVEQFLRNTNMEEASPAEWIKYAKDEHGDRFAPVAMIDNPAFRELWGVERPSPDGKKVTGLGQNEGAKAVVRLVEEIKSRAAKAGEEFNQREAPGTLSDFTELANAWGQKNDRRLIRSKDSIDNYRSGIVTFRSGRPNPQGCDFYRRMFPELKFITK